MHFIPIVRCSGKAQLEAQLEAAAGVGRGRARRTEGTEINTAKETLVKSHRVYRQHQVGAKPWASPDGQVRHELSPLHHRLTQDAKGDRGGGLGGGISDT